MSNFTKKLLTVSLSVALLFQLASPAFASTDLPNEGTSATEVNSEVTISNEESTVNDVLAVESEDLDLETVSENSDADTDSKKSETVTEGQETEAAEEETLDQAQEKASAEKESGNVEEKVNVEKENTVEEETKNVVEEDATELTEGEKTVSTLSQTTYSGIALKDPTNVYKEPNSSKGAWKTYAQGSILKYHSYSDNWYKATVSVNGKWQTGYIHKSDVENIDTSNQKQVSGIALKNPTKVYKRAATSSGSWKEYAQGSILKYKTFSKDWYVATVYVNGKKRTGYIHKSDVENVDAAKQENYRGIALKNPTKIFDKASTNAKALKSYKLGTVLKYRSFSKNWYQATVYVNGKKRTGYIHKSHVETAQTSNQENYQGVALKEPTRVYKQASTSLGAWKSYSKGTILKYRSFSKNYYEATVYVGGKRKTGYILKSDVENAVKNQTRLKGIGLKKPTPVYDRASTNANVLKSYEAGNTLILSTFTSDWYQVTVYVKGKRTTGYIHNSHVDELVKNNGESLQVIAKDQVNAYAGPSRNSKVLKPYAKFSVLKVKTLSKNWYEATVYVDGKRNRAFFNVNDVSADHVITNKYYDITFEEFVDLQMNQSTPKSDGAGKIPATREEVEKYANPANFKAGTPEYFQFLVLTSFAGLSVKDLNNYLSDKGSLQGQGQAFIDAAKKHGINEVYLLSHALHETGNGTSTLANGIPVDIEGNVIRDSNGKIDYNKNHPNYHTTVYNFFGYGAHDDDAINDGARYAFEQGWTSKYDAIVGGAASIGNNYVKKGQDTLYKMRWNVDQAVNDGAVWKQYATHVAWATIQTKNIFNIYNSLTNYILAFEVPVFKN